MIKLDPNKIIFWHKNNVDFIDKIEKRRDAK